MLDVQVNKVSTKYEVLSTTNMIKSKAASGEAALLFMFMNDDPFKY